MQRSAKNKTAEETVPGASHQAASPFDTEEIHGPPRIVVVEGGRHPLLRLGAGTTFFWRHQSGNRDVGNTAG